MYLNRATLCDRSRRRRVDNFKLKALNVLSFGAVTNNLTCLIILMLNQDEVEVIDIVIHFSDLLFYLVMVAFMNLMNRENWDSRIN
ncbi:Oidioi.mRNA.OKI2018_I69.chr2.g4564.t1.cds [Oikopleura dioica]|uniref:Oidioi.mRNA.OKI2018_I69.chr2.g4564.t1.cds n=1 Tax=Oikopleura dioica TaxID=34765 RepID=A0ABN7SXB6_OIKDI|nr:Oidioi.mRNA.OKI2018_I69.chr2.g4564.t1.cds [Oikopleura dioica]